MPRFFSSSFLALGTLGAAAALATSTQGCSAILGDFSVGPETDASTTGAANEAGTLDSEALDGATADGTASGSRPDATLPDGGSAGDAGTGSGTGEGGLTDGGGAICSPGSSQCSADGGVEDCVSGTWATPVPCTNSVCSMGQCTGTCSPNTAQCSGNSVQRCDSTGHLGTPEPCVSQACVAGACQGVCVPGNTRCADAGAETCGMDGSWGTPTGCGANQTCTGGGTTTAACSCKTTACTSSGTVCTDGSDLASCMQDGHGCWYPSAPTACTNGACFGSAGSASCCTNQCTTGATKCGGAGVQTCQAQGNGCTAYNAGAACGTHQACTGSTPNAQCTCTADPTCTSASNVCSGTTLTTCAEDTQNCFYAAGSASCGANEQCSLNACACENGFTSCSGACVDTMSDINNCGACGTVCPTVAAPSTMACMSGTCIGYIGGAVAASSPPTAVESNPDMETIAAVKATMPAVAGTFQGFGAVVGSTSPSGDGTTVLFALYDNSGGMPNEPLIDTTNSTITFDDPSALHAVQSGGYISDQSGGFVPSLPANSTYWVYFKSAGDATTDTVGVSTAQTICRSGWINYSPPGSFTGVGAATCTGDYQAYMIVSFP
jgi:hypothetical protein